MSKAQLPSALAVSIVPEASFFHFSQGLKLGNTKEIDSSESFTGVPRAGRQNLVSDSQTAKAVKINQTSYPSDPSSGKINLIVTYEPP